MTTKTLDPIANSQPTIAREPEVANFPTVLHARVITGAGGGPDKTMLNSPRFLEPLGYRAICVYLRPPGDEGFQAIRDRAAQWDSPLFEIDDRGPFDTSIIARAIEICKKENVQIWHAHDYKTNLLGLLVRRKWPMRLVSTVHGWVQLTLRTRLYHSMDRFTLPRYERVVCVSPDILESCRKHGIKQEKSLLIDNAIDTQQFRRSQTRAQARKKLGLDESANLIGAVGRLSPEKGFDRLISVVHVLNSQGLKVNLVIIGEGGQRDELQALIEQHDLQKQVRLVGFQAKPADWYQAMDAFVLSSLREGLPNVVLEAMALETPVVTTAVAGVPGLVEDGVSGLVVPIADDDALKAAIARMLGDTELQTRLATQARVVIESRFSFAARMTKMADVYGSVIES